MTVGFLAEEGACLVAGGRMFVVKVLVERMLGAVGLVAVGRGALVLAVYLVGASSAFLVGSGVVIVCTAALAARDSARPRI